MPPRTLGRQRPKGPPPGETGQEALYLRFLSEKQVPVTVKLRDGEAVYGWIEYFDDRMIRLTREGKPNLFIYKNQIRTISESFRNIEARRRDRNRSGAKSSQSKDASILAVSGSEGSGLPPALQPPVITVPFELRPIALPKSLGDKSSQDGCAPELPTPNGNHQES